MPRSFVKKEERRERKRKGCNKEERREKRKAKGKGVNEEEKGEKGEELVKLEKSTLLLGSRLFLL